MYNSATFRLQRKWEKRTEKLKHLAPRPPPPFLPLRFSWACRSERVFFSSFGPFFLLWLSLPTRDRQYNTHTFEAKNSAVNQYFRQLHFLSARSSKYRGHTCGRCNRAAFHSISTTERYHRHTAAVARAPPRCHAAGAVC